MSYSKLAWHTWTVTFLDKGLVLWDEITVDRVLEINDLKNTEIEIYPNPSNGIINIISENTFEKPDIYIYSVTGSLVPFDIIEISPSKIIIKLNETQSGIYLVKINTQNTVTIKRLIIK